MPSLPRRARPKGGQPAASTAHRRRPSARLAQSQVSAWATRLTRRGWPLASATCPQSALPPAQLSATLQHGPTAWRTAAPDDACRGSRSHGVCRDRRDLYPPMARCGPCPGRRVRLRGQLPAAPSALPSEPVTGEQTYCDRCYGPITDADRDRSRRLGLDGELSWACCACIDAGRTARPPDGWHGRPEEWPVQE
jgi:hypothetical protein